MVNSTLLREEKIYTKTHVRKMIYAAYKAGQGGYPGDGSDLGVQNYRLRELRRLFPKIFTERQPGHVTRHERDKIRRAAKGEHGPAVPKPPQLVAEEGMLNDKEFDFMCVHTRGRAPGLLWAVSMVGDKSVLFCGSCWCKHSAGAQVSFPMTPAKNE